MAKGKFETETKTHKQQHQPINAKQSNVTFLTISCWRIILHMCLKRTEPQNRFSNNRFQIVLHISQPILQNLNLILELIEEHRVLEGVAVIYVVEFPHTRCKSLL
eukprot:c25765_g1_i1.p1 GENE.c25765_g1_i1~~c25765_g1_i1.p1  ORF type:complete len:105 (+),score=19.17 c25765_g1_i1:61-375(+)